MLREQSVEKPNDVNAKEISDTKEQGDGPGSGSRDLIDNDATSRLTAAPSEIRTSGRKRKHIDDELYKRY